MRVLVDSRKVEPKYSPVNVPVSLGRNNYIRAGDRNLDNRDHPGKDPTANLAAKTTGTHTARCSDLGNVDRAWIDVANSSKTPRAYKKLRKPTVAESKFEKYIDLYTTNIVSYGLAYRSGAATAAASGIRGAESPTISPTAGPSKKNARVDLGPSESPTTPNGRRGNAYTNLLDRIASATD